MGTKVPTPAGKFMIEVRTPCRLHFGLLAYGGQAARQFGGVGLMVRRPDIVVQVDASAQMAAAGPMAEKALAYAQRVASSIVPPPEALSRKRPSEVSVRVLRCPRAHAGLGTGTQLGMAVARAMGALMGREAMSAAELAALSGRGMRSAIGAHGFLHGGFIVEGGKSDADALSPLLLHKPFPPAWRIVLITPHGLEGLSDRREREAFAGLASIPEEATARMCKLVLLGMVPALVECNVRDFGEALFELQQIVGSCFAAAQGGVYADPLLAQIVAYVRARGIAGIGQSSWGPTMYAIAGNDADAQHLASGIASEFGLGEDEVMVTEADNRGGVVNRQDSAKG